MAVVASSINEPPAQTPTQHNGFPLLTASRLSIPSSSGSPSPVSTPSELGDDADHTITAKRDLRLSKPPSQEDNDLRLLAVSSQITEVAYSISDIQTRIFEIQELRHKAQAEPQSSTGSSTSSAEIDQALINLDERLETVSRSITVIGEALAPLRTKTPTPAGEDLEDSLILRKHQDLLAEWDAAQNDAETLRSELHEDKWLAVFRTVSEQADGMMSSLEKAVQQCQEFIYQVLRHDHHSASSSGRSLQPEKLPNFEVFSSLLQSYEAKKKHYEPSITKVLSVLDKGVRDRVTKNGECLRRHGDSRARWRNLRERIARTDTEMENVRRILVNRDREPESSEAGSSVSRFTSKSKSNLHLSAPSPSRSRYASSSASAGSTSTSTLARSMSPIKKFAAKVTAGIMTPGRVTPTSQPPTSPRPSTTEQSSKRSSFFPFRKPSQTPDRSRPSLSGPYPLGAAPAASTRELQRKPSQPQLQRKVSQQHLGVDNATIKAKWNSSTKVDPADSAIPKLPPVPRSRAPSAMGHNAPSTPARSQSPTSQASSRPWSPVTSSRSTATSQTSPPNTARPSSRATSRIGAATPYGTVSNPRARPTTPSQIPMPVFFGSRGSGSQSSSEDGDEPPTTLMQRMSPTQSSAPSAPSATTTPTHGHTRSVSRSMIPVPKLNFNGPSRPGSAMSQYRSTSPSLTASSSSPARPHTPEAVLKARAQQMPFYNSSPSVVRPKVTKNGAPPTSYRDGATPTPGRTVSRPGSRAAGTFTPSLEQNPVPLYGPANTKDPLDVEVAKTVNGFPHGFLIERVDPPLRTAPRPGEEVKAQYSVSNALGKKVITCRLVVLNRSNPKTAEETQTRKVMCRVGGGWLDLQMYLLNRQAGLS